MRNTTDGVGGGLSFRRLDVYRVAMELVGAVEALRVADVALRDQVTRAASSVALNLAEGLPLTAGARRRHLTIARGSAHEVVAATDVAEARHLVGTGDADAIRTLCDRLLAMLWRMTR